MISELLASCPHPATLPTAVRAFETLRRARCERVQEISRQNREFLAVPDGPGQQARDAALAANTAATEGRIRDGSLLANKPGPDMGARFPSPEATMWLFGYDGIGEARAWIAKEGLGG